MSSFYRVFDDVPPIPVDEFGPLNMPYVSNGYNAPADVDGYWQPVSSANEDPRLVHGPGSHLRNMEFHLSDLERTANGMGCLSVPQKLLRPTHLDQPWDAPEQYFYPDRSERYVSPGGVWGGDVSSSEMGSSSPSDAALSPDSSQNLSAFPKAHCDWNMYGPSGVETPSHGGFGGFCIGNETYFGQASGHPLSNSNPLVAMRDIQQYPDPEPRTEEEDCYSRTTKVEPVHSGNFPHPLTPALADSGIGESVKDEESCNDDGEDDEDNYSDYNPRKRSQRRSSYSTRNVGLSSPRTRRTRQRAARTDENYKVNKRTRTSTTDGPKQKSQRTLTQSSPRRPFVCTFAQYGCPASFGSKNEWKRHVSSQHLQLGYFRCDVGHCNPENVKAKSGGTGSRAFNDFNRKDLFTQHQRRMHSPWPASKTPSQQAKDEFESSLEGVRERCWRENRLPPQRSVCGICDRVFDGASSWEERMEHVGKHYEKGEADGEEKEDEELREWAVREGLVRQVEHGRWRLRGLKEDKVRDARSTRGGTRSQGDDDEDAEGDPE